MISLISVFISQIKILLIGGILLSLRYILSGDNKNISEFLPNDFTNKYFLTFLLVLWFVIFPGFIYYYQLPQYGIWSYLLE